MKNGIKYLISLLFTLLLLSCSSTKKNEEVYIVDEYTTIFPNTDVADELEQISKSIRLINNMTFYRSYHFADSTVTEENIGEFDFFDKAIFKNTISKTSSGTGAIINITGNNVALLTAAHIISYPDTIFTYFSDGARISKYLESISFKERQIIYSDLPDRGLLKIIIQDDKNDIAIIGNEFKNISLSRFPVFDFKLGKAKELKWGSFVYLLGFPMLHKMVTSGIVSNPDYNGTGNFLVDAPINRGSSGGPVLAIRGRAPNFELVGIVSSAPAEERLVLTPNNPMRRINYQLGASYEGEMIIEKIDGIKYGIGKIVSSEKIKTFINKNKEKLEERGYLINIEE